jgi:hypothetical protein
MLPHLMQERARIQAMRQRSDTEILPLLGRLNAPQFAGPEYAAAAAKLASAIGLFDLTDQAGPPRVLVVSTQEQQEAATELARSIAPRVAIAVALIGGDSRAVQPDADTYTVHSFAAGSREFESLMEGADVVLAFSDAPRPGEARAAGKPVLALGRPPTGDSAHRIDPANVDEVVAYCLRRGLPS